MLVLASKSYPTLNAQSVKCHERSQHNLSASGQYSESYSGMKAGRTLKEVKNATRNAKTIQQNKKY